MTADIVDATPADAAAIAALIAEAFQHLDVAQWLVPPSAEQRRSVLEADFRIFVDHALSHGIVQTSPNRTGVAMWFPPAAQAREPADYDVRLAAACGPWIDRFRALDTAFAEHHPHSPAHHHLGFLAVRPDRQCRGLGSDLLRHHHQRLDEAGLPAYVEASSTRSRALYLRHGYRPHGEPFSPVDGGPPLWPLWRQPASG